MTPTKPLLLLLQPPHHCYCHILHLCRPYSHISTFAGFFIAILYLSTRCPSHQNSHIRHSFLSCSNPFPTIPVTVPLISPAACKRTISTSCKVLYYAHASLWAKPPVPASQPVTLCIFNFLINLWTACLEVCIWVHPLLPWTQLHDTYATLHRKCCSPNHRPSVITEQGMTHIQRQNWLSVDTHAGFFPGVKRMVSFAGFWLLYYWLCDHCMCLAETKPLDHIICNHMNKDMCCERHRFVFLVCAQMKCFGNAAANMSSTTSGSFGVRTPSVD